MRILLLLLLAGCNSLPTDNRTPEQISAAVKDKSITATCAKTSTLTVTATVAQLTVDASVIKHGGIAINADDCSINLVAQ